MAEKKKVVKQKIRITVKAFDHTIIDKAVKMIIDTAERSGAIIAGPIPLPTKIKKFTVNRSTFIAKNSREQFEMRIHKRLIDIDSEERVMRRIMRIRVPEEVHVTIELI